MTEPEKAYASCSLEPSYTILEEFDRVDLKKICDFFEKYAGKSCKIIHEWYSADLGITENLASLCVDLDYSDQANPGAVFIYEGPREKDSPITVALGRVINVSFLKVEQREAIWYFVELQDEAGVLARLSATQCQVFSYAYNNLQD